MECFQCRTQNTDDKKYCGACGSPLSFSEIVAKAVAVQLDTALSERFRDASLVQTELVANAAKKLSGWVKLFTFYVGIPVTVVVLVLGFLGLTTYRGFKETVDNAVSDFKSTVADRKVQVDDLTSKTHDLDTTVSSLSAKLPYYEALGSRMEAADAKVQQLAGQQEDLKKEVDLLARDTSLNDLQPKVAELARRLIATARQNGTDVAVWETCRSEKRQTAMFNQGETAVRNTGMHGVGLAFDIVRIVNGEPNWKGDYADVGAIGKKLGLTWGGDWGSPEAPHQFINSKHFQLGTMAEQPSLVRSTPVCSLRGLKNANVSSPNP